MDKELQFKYAAVRDLSIPTDSIDLAEITVADEVEVGVTENSITQVKAERFVDLIEHGETPGEAARKIGTTLRNINSSANMKAYVEELVNTANLTADVRQLMVRSGLNKLFMRSIDSEDLEERKLALATAKLISQDPEVGAGSADTEINVDLRDMTAALRGVRLEGIPDKKELLGNDDTKE